MEVGKIVYWDTGRFDPWGGVIRKGIVRTPPHAVGMLFSATPGVWVEPLTPHHYPDQLVFVPESHMCEKE